MKIKKQLALGLCFVMAAPMSALAGEISEEDKLKTYDPVITLTFAKPEVVKTYAEGEDAQNNSAYAMWEEVMGIHVENQILAPSGSMTEKLQLAIGSNDIPDFAIVDATMMASLIKNDMVEDMTDVYETWATDDLKQLTEQNDKGLFAPVTNSDGRYMGISCS